MSKVLKLSLYSPLREGTNGRIIDGARTVEALFPLTSIGYMEARPADGPPGTTIHMTSGTAYGRVFVRELLSEIEDLMKE